jgi:S-(hydroxymethyl)glutathione dehydrogenase / alcohol dehydrogenase
MKTRAAVAYEAGKPLVVEEVELEGPRAGEVPVELAIFGHEGAGVVVDVGAGVTTVKKGDHVIPLYTPECRQCKSCLSRTVVEFGT